MQDPQRKRRETTRHGRFSHARLDSWVRMRVRAFVRVCARTFAASSASSSSEASSPKSSCSCNPKRPLASRRTRNEDACYMLSPFRYREHSLARSLAHRPDHVQTPPTVHTTLCCVRSYGGCGRLRRAVIIYRVTIVFGALCMRSGPVALRFNLFLLLALIVSPALAFARLQRKTGAGLRYPTAYWNR